MDGVFKTSKLVYTTGYDRLPYGKMKGAHINRSYALVTEPNAAFAGWHEQALIWETARPYIYMRTTADGRVVIGGLDESKEKPEKKDEKIDKMGDQLLARLHDIFPQTTFQKAYQYCASFGESKDQLPFIGQHPKQPRHYYLLGYGGNGTVYSMLGSRILADLIVGRPNDTAHIVTLARPNGLKQ